MGADAQVETGEAWTHHAPLTGTTEIESADGQPAAFEPTGPYTFRQQGGGVGWFPQHRDAALRLVPEDESWRAAGTVSVWVSPVEEIDHWSEVPGWPAGIALLPIVTDVYPPRRVTQSVLGLYANTNWHPGMLVKCLYGNEGSYYACRPRALVPATPMRQHHWYHVAVAWDTSRGLVEMYLNGEWLNGADGMRPDEVRDALYIGNPLMCLADLRLAPRRLEPAVVQQCFEAERAGSGRVTDPGVEQILHGHSCGRLEPDTSGYTRIAAETLTDPAEVERWTRHGPDDMAVKECRATPEGMLLETHPTWDDQNLCYLWSPYWYEGDFILRYKFRVESDLGLAIVVFDASTHDRQDVVDQPNYPITGAMITINRRVRCYWWEYMRRTPPVPHDRCTHLLAKGPYQRPLADNVRTNLPQRDVWHELVVQREAGRVRCGIDGDCIADVRDDPGLGHGPVHNCGRIGLRHMQRTRVRYRDFELYTRPQEDPG
jgi:hypothetical protein